VASDSLGETCTTSISSASTLAAGNVWYRIIETMKWMRFIAVFCGKRQSRPRR
jgi:hypothetical protein